MKVTDSEATTYEKRLNVAVSGEVTGIENVWSEADIDVAKREFFTLDGKQATTFRQNGFWCFLMTFLWSQADCGFAPMAVPVATMA